MKDCQRLLNIDDKFLPHKSILAEISRAKDMLVPPEEFLNLGSGNYREKQIGECYAKYQKLLKSADAMDFDDIIFYTVKLLKENDDVREYYQRKFRYVLVDEYQDTNHAQFMLTKLLSEGYNNICVVGDDDQSIYKFRGATIENILSFENNFKNAQVIRLEQNYRSTQNILTCANVLISKNQNRKGKNLWTSSFVLVVGAYSLAMFALFYYLIDVRGWSRWSLPFQVIGVNSITIYMAQKVISFSHINKFFLGGVANALPEEWGTLLLKAGYVAVCWLFLYFLYRKKIFLKV